MINGSIKCPYCQNETKQVKNGFNQSGSQRYRANTAVANIPPSPKNMAIQMRCASKRHGCISMGVVVAEGGSVGLLVALGVSVGLGVMVWVGRGVLLGIKVAVAEGTLALT